ncbi:cytochrome P450 family 71 subfamily B polypeptide 4 [Euphorbia peplus]|nr:cytochrome P450 family 71 subfamily B polypeptide 4 [Euphorbia peplus]
MDFQYPSSSFQILASFLLFIFTLFFITTKTSKSATKKSPPGPWKVPIIGNLHNLIGALPHHCLYKLSKKHGPIMHLKLGEINTIVISSPEMAKEAMKTHDLTFSSRPFSLAADTISYGSTDLIFAVYGDYWRQLRKICVVELLSAKRVQSFRSIREEEVMNIMKSISDSASEGAVINFSKILYKYMYSVISRAAFGKVRKEQEAFVPRVKEIMELAAGFTLADVFPSVKFLQRIGGLKAKMERIHNQADEILEAIIQDHKARKQEDDDEHDDLVDVLLRFQDKGNPDQFSLNMDNIKAVILVCHLGNSVVFSIMFFEL